jgi:multiple sugar transport system permease protein
MPDALLDGASSVVPGMRRRPRRLELGRRLRAPILHILLIGLAFVMLYPVLWMIASSLRPDNEMFATSALIPSHPTMENYIKGWEFMGRRSFGSFFVNSFAICGLAVAGNLVSCSMAAYAFARLRFRGRGLWFALMLGSIMLPVHAQLIPQYILFLKIGWLNTILPLVVPKFLAVDAFFIFLMVQFMRTLPVELEQAAQLDGAGFWQRYFYVILPLSLPALVTTAVFTFIFVYNDYLSQLIYLTSDTKMTLPLALRLFIDTGGGTSSYGGMFAMSVLSLVPVLTLFLLAQRHIVHGFATSGIK